MINDLITLTAESTLDSAAEPREPTFIMSHFIIKVMKLVNSAKNIAWCASSFKYCSTPYWILIVPYGKRLKLQEVLPVSSLPRAAPWWPSDQSDEDTLFSLLILSPWSSCPELGSERQKYDFLKLFSVQEHHITAIMDEALITQKRLNAGECNGQGPSPSEAVDQGCRPPALPGRTVGCTAGVTWCLFLRSSWPILLFMSSCMVCSSDFISSLVASSWFSSLLMRGSQRQPLSGACRHRHTIGAQSEPWQTAQLTPDQ